MKRIQQCMMGVAVALALVLGAATQASAECGNGVLDFDPVKGTNEECDVGQATCTGGLRDGFACATEADCPAGDCSGGDPGGGVATDNRDDIENSCRSDCTLPVCGDGVTDTDFGEDCDDGNDSNTDTCLNTCEAPTCGDGFICSAQDCTTGPGGGKELCDPADVKGTDGCYGPDPTDTDNPGTLDCAPKVCGDGVQTGSEECDQGQGTCNAASINAGQLCGDNDACLGGDCDDCLAAPTVVCSGAGPNNDSVANNCRSDCTLPTCGDGVVDSSNGEACDDGNDSNNDGCLNTCELATCGDEFLCDENNPDAPCTSGPTGGKEECDAGVKGSEGCDVDCSLVACGDGTVQDPEECDAGQSTCNASANGIVDGADCTSDDQCFGGACDGGNNDDDANTCRGNCTLPSCGDGVSDAGESCDDGNTSNNDGCLNDCTVASCGDEFVCSENNADSPCTTGPTGGKEECDLGVKGGDGCTTTCALTSCGDGSQNGAEECDFGQGTCGAGSLNAGALCGGDSDCFNGVCDGCLTGVTCSAGGPNNDDVADTCRSNCTLPECGDGTTDTVTDETCDDGNTSNNDTCLNNCRPNICGDGNLCSFDDLKDPDNGSNCEGVCTDGAVGCDEACDDGNDDDLDGCTSACALTSCGDGTVNSGEECDLGTSTCTGSALVPDGTACASQVACFGGVCAGGNLNEADTCKTNCQLPACGDGISDTLAGEECDTDPTAAGETCNDDCTANTCGDGILGRSEVDLGAGPVVQPEACDDGNVFPGDGCSQFCTVEMCGDGLTTASFDPTEHEECDAGLPLQHPDPNGGPVPVQHQGNCTSVCCWFGGVLPEGQPSSPTLPEGTFTNIHGAFDSLTGCHLPKLIDTTSCSRYTQRPAIRLEKLISQGRGAYNSNNFQKAIRKLRRAKRVISRIDRALVKSRVQAACESASHVISDQQVRISALTRDVQNLMPLF